MMHDSDCNLRVMKRNFKKKLIVKCRNTKFHYVRPYIIVGRPSHLQKPGGPKMGRAALRRRV